MDRTPADWGKWLLSKLGLQRGILNALQNKPIYHGTVASSEVARRRKRNKAARRSRRINRMARKG